MQDQSTQPTQVEYETALPDLTQRKLAVTAIYRSQPDRRMTKKKQREVQAEHSTLSDYLAYKHGLVHENTDSIRYDI